MIHRELDHLPNGELAPHGFEDIVSTPGESPAIVAPEDPRLDSRVVAHRVEKDQGVASDPRELREHSRPGRVRQVMGDVDAKREIEASGGKRKLGGVADESDAVRTPASSRQHGSGIDIE